MICAAQRNSVRGLKRTVGRIEAVNLEADTRSRHPVELRLQALDIRRLLYRVDEALVPDAGLTLWHWRYISRDDGRVIGGTAPKDWPSPT